MISLARRFALGAALVGALQVPAYAQTNPNIDPNYKRAVDALAKNKFDDLLKIHGQLQDAHRSGLTVFVVGGVALVVTVGSLGAGTPITAPIVGSVITLSGGLGGTLVVTEQKRREMLVTIGQTINAIGADIDKKGAQRVTDEQMQYLRYALAADFLRFDRANPMYADLKVALEKFGILAQFEELAHNANQCVASPAPNNAAVCAWFMGNLTEFKSELRLYMGRRIRETMEEAACRKGPRDPRGYSICLVNAERAANDRPYELTNDAWHVPPGVRPGVITRDRNGWDWLYASNAIDEMRGAYDKVYPRIASNGGPPVLSYTAEEKALADLYVLLYATDGTDARIAAAQRFGASLLESLKGRNLGDAILGFLSYTSVALANPDVRAALAIDALRKATTDEERSRALRLWAEAVVARETGKPLALADPSVITATLTRKIAETYLLLADGSIQRTQVDGERGITRVVTVRPDGSVKEEITSEKGIVEVIQRDRRGRVVSHVIGTRDGRFEETRDANNNVIRQRVTDGDDTIRILDRNGNLIERQVVQNDGSIRTYGSNGTLKSVLRPAAQVDSADPNAVHYVIDDYEKRVTTWGNGTKTESRNWDTGEVTTIIGDLKCDDRGCRRNDAMSEGLLAALDAMEDLACKLNRSFCKLDYTGIGFGSRGYEPGQFVDACWRIGATGMVNVCVQEDYRSPYLAEDKATGHLIDYSGGDVFTVLLPPWDKQPIGADGKIAPPSSATGSVRVWMRHKIARCVVWDPVRRQNVPCPTASEDFTFDSIQCLGAASSICNGPALIKRYKHILEGVYYSHFLPSQLVGQPVPSEATEVLSATDLTEPLPRGGIATYFAVIGANATTEPDASGCRTTLDNVRVELMGPNEVRTAACIVRTDPWQIDFVVPPQLDLGEYVVRLIRASDGALVGAKLVTVGDPPPALARDPFDRYSPRGWVVRNVGSDQRVETLNYRVEVGEGDVWIVLAASGLQRNGVSVLLNDAPVTPDYAGVMPGTRYDQLNLRLSSQAIGTQRIRVCADGICGDPLEIETFRQGRAAASGSAMNRVIDAGRVLMRWLGF